MNIREQIIQNCLDGKNTMILSPGGTGKSHLIKYLKIEADKKGINISICSTTGVGAVQVSGTTLHSWAGIGLGDDTVSRLIKKLRKDMYCMKRWNDTRILVIDEVSMLGASIFDKLETIARIIKGNDAFFGGIILFVVGDMCQLPPVNDGYIYEADCWRRFEYTGFVLNKYYRFRDRGYAELLLRIRWGMATNDDIELLKAKASSYNKEEIASLEITPTILFSRKKDVEYHNISKLEKLDTQSRTYYASDFYSPLNDTKSNIHFMKMFDDKVPKSLFLKEGAQVMLVCNLDTKAGFINGSRGVVTKLKDTQVSVKFTNEITVTIVPYTWELHKKDTLIASRRQIPLVVSYAISIHKSQGCTLDSMVVDLGTSIFADFQAYVALSRVRSFNGLYISSFSKRALKVNNKVLKFMKDFEKSAIVEPYYDNDFCEAYVKPENTNYGYICKEGTVLGSKYCIDHIDLEYEELILDQWGYYAITKYLVDSNICTQYGYLYELSQK